MKLFDYLKCFAYILIFLTLAIWCALNEGYAFYINSFVQYNNLLLWLLIVTTALCFFFIVPGRSILLHLFILCLGCFLLFGMMFYQGIGTEQYFIEQKSCDHKHKIIINERKEMFQCRGTIYERKTFFYMKKIGEYTTDFIFPVRDGAYTIKWEKKGFIFTYQHIRREIKLQNGQKRSNFENLKVLYQK